MPKKEEVLVFSEYWQRYGCLDEDLELSSRRAWNFGVLQTQRIYLPVVQENEKLKAEIKKLKAKERRLTKRAADKAVRICSRCGTTNVKTAKKCYQCGNRLATNA